MRRRASAAKVEIDSSHARKILNELNRRCLQATKEVGDEMGFVLDNQSFQVEISPGKISSIDFFFTVQLFGK